MRNPEPPQATASHTRQTQRRSQRCADWFESLSSRPVVRTEWPVEDGTYAIRWEFADTGEVLATSGTIAADGSSPVRYFPIRP